jgi:primosomal protein N' (replication factor Y)
VAVNIPQVSGMFDYIIPAHWEDALAAGSLVTVPFGRQVTQGIVVSFPEEPAVPEPRALESLLEINPVVTSHQIALAGWMAEENLTTLAANLDLMLPPGLSQHADILVRRVNPDSPSGLTLVQERILDLLAKRGELRGQQLDVSLPRTDWRKSLPGLVKHGWVISTPILRAPTVRPKWVRTAQFMRMPTDETETKAIGKPNTPAFERRLNALHFLAREAIAVNVPFIYAESGCNAADLTLLAGHGLIRLSETEIWRDPLAALAPVLSTPPTLTPEQRLVVEALQKQIRGETTQKPNLLQGVTSSGKTEVYLQAVAETLMLGKTAIVLVPEISLTPQTVRRFFARFPGQVALVHSQLSPGERYDTWRRIRAGELKVVVGARSALFAPVNDLGLIVLDECHDGSYHQEDTNPRYHAPAAAMAYAELCDAVLLMGSATPEVETLHLFQKNHWNLFHLPNRVLAHGNAVSSEGSTPSSLPMPAIEVVDMRAELVAGNRSALSRCLQQGLREVLESHAQAILFLNRRGSASYIFCRACGFVLRCSRCDTQMTFHEKADLLVCHHCNHQRKMPSTCPNCASPQIKQFGLGTERLEKMVVDLFPSARVLRWDADTTQTKGAHDLILDHFIHQRADILIGTQMLAKGLDLPKVTLVGAVLADVSLNLPDFRAGEHSFQLLTQVAGRAGRSVLGGKVIFQTFQPEHYAIQKAAAYDFSGFESLEIEFRKKLGYPPFGRLLRIELQHSNPGILESAARDVGARFTAWLNTEDFKHVQLIGPAPCFYQRRAAWYRWQILLLGAQPTGFLMKHPVTTWQPSGVKVEITVDPLNLL